MAHLLGNRGINRVGIVCHDAGSAELLSRYFLKFNCELFLDLSGPSRDIFKRNGYVEPDLDRPWSDVIDLVVTGISWMDTSYVRIIHDSKLRRIPVITFLDHWAFDMNIFEYEGLCSLPNALVVFDEFAYKRASRTFPETSILSLPNHYFKDIRREYRKFSRNDSEGFKVLLYVSEPIISSGDSQNYSELESFNYMIKNLNLIDSEVSEVIIRPHPSEDEVKYIDRIDSDFVKISLSKNKKLVEDLALSHIVAGHQTMALAVASQLGLRTISIIPAGFGECVIPFPAIEMLRDITNSNN